MREIQGKGVSKGVASGPLYFFKRSDTAVIKQIVDDTEAQKARVRAAQDQSIKQLNALAAQCRKESGDEAALLFETHALFVEDEVYVAVILDVLEREQCNAEYAVEQAGEQFSALLAVTDDEYMRQRAADIKDVTRRILHNLTGITEDGIDSDQPVILAADDLAPSETLQLDRTKILGFITQDGSDNSHTAILARTMGLPAICAVGDALQPGYEGRIACMDGETGCAVLDPDEETLKAFQEKREEQARKRELLESMKGQKDVTLDGRKIELCCNINVPDDVDAVLANDGQGIGLFRSEFLFLTADGYPGEEEQFQAYQKVARAMGGKRVVIRTCDIGSDKQADYFEGKKEENPAMGVRAIRISLNRPDFFHTQLRAIYRASAYGNVAILFPMITSVWEIQECLDACAGVRKELEEEGISFNPDTEIGIMVETPASVFMAPELAQMVDFFSVGTNDLTQFILACDRQNHDLGRFYDPHHPAVIRALTMVARAAHEAGIRIGICGELGADPEMLETFLAIGIDELSVSPSSVLGLRAAIRESSAKDGSQN